ncbi:unnamed protein product [Anisakis simplex]|uniref:AAA_12 domain-containing protein n=1 Tax=Anisakis simplex TaxID=6269 RepID=A0A0M3JZX3_ANISI|nr:unnamed protein product [Anisakis simplex]
MSERLSQSQTPSHDNHHDESQEQPVEDILAIPRRTLNFFTRRLQTLTNVLPFPSITNITLSLPRRLRSLPSTTTPQPVSPPPPTMQTLSLSERLASLHITASSEQPFFVEASQLSQSVPTDGSEQVPISPQPSTLTQELPPAIPSTSQPSLHPVIQAYKPPCQPITLLSDSTSSSVISLGNDVFLPEPVTYIVSQCLTNQVVLVIEPSQSRHILDQAPALLQFTDYTQFYYDGHNCGTGFNKFNVYPFSLFEVLVYAPLIIHHRQAPVQTFHPQIILQNLCADRIRANAAAQFAVPFERQPSIMSILSLTQHANVKAGDRRNLKSQPRILLQYVGRHAEKTQTVPHYLVDSFTSRPLEGDVVHAHYVHAPQLAQIAINYVLPPGYPFDSNNHFVTRDFADTVLICISPADPTHPALQLDPFSRIRADDQDQLLRICRNYEDILLATAIFIRNRIIHAMSNSAYVGTSYTLHDNILAVSVPAINDPRIMSLRVRFWEPDVRMHIIPSIYRQQDKRHPPVSAVIQDIQLDPDMNMKATIVLRDADVQKLCRLITQAGEELVIEPDSTRTGLESRIDYLRYRYISTMLQSTTAPQCSHILRLLLGIPRQLSYTPNTSPLTNLTLTDEQCSVIQHLKGNCPILFQQAPAGTGKTFVISAFIQEHMQTVPLAITFLAATTNMAVSNMAQAILKLVPQLAHTEFLYMQSLTDERLTRSDDSLWAPYRMPELMSRLVDLQYFRDDQLQFARDYVNNRIAHDGTGCHEHKALDLVLQTKTVRLICGTIAILEQFLSSLEDYIERCIIDGAGFVPEVQLLTLVSGMPNLQQVFLTGDLHQLPAYKANIPDKLLKYGCDSAIASVARRNVIPMFSLNISYRSHPFLTFCLSETVYNGQLRPGVSADDRSLLTHSDFPLPIPSIPLALIHISSSDVINTRRSRYNRGQENAAIHIANRLTLTIDSHKITVLCFYLASRDYIRSQLDGTSINCHTVDSFQGKENDVIILVTTRSYDYCATDDQVKFFADPQRITVALSRARHGLFIIADFPMLLKYGIWQKYLRLATQETPIVNSRYVAAIFNDVHRNHRNLLVDAHGKPFLPLDTFFINRKWHQY